MSQQQNLALSSTDNQVSSPDYGPFGMPEFHPPSEPVSAYPGNMENYEMERYVLQSLELLASTPTTQYYGPEIPQSDALPRTPRSAASPPRYDRWDGRTSFQQVHQRVIGGQDHDQQHCYPVSSSTSQSPAALVPIYTNVDYHDHGIPEDQSAAESSNSQGKVVEPTLKRQRNTAASARFRAKKKRNEQMQADSARERESIINKLENRVTELETENRWLKDLLIDKAEAIARIDSKAIADERKGCEHKDGVGTSSK